MTTVKDVCSKRDSMIVNLRKYDALPHYAIAEIMNTSEDYVRAVCCSLDKVNKARQKRLTQQREQFNAERGHSEPHRVSEPGPCECSDPSPDYHLATDAYYCRECGGWIQPRQLSEEIVAARNDISDRLQKIYTCRNRALKPLKDCRWTELEEVLGEMHGHVEWLLGRVSEVRHQYGEPEA